MVYSDKKIETLRYKSIKERNASLWKLQGKFIIFHNLPCISIFNTIDNWAKVENIR